MSSSTLVGRYWRGEGPLWRVYWLYGVAFSLVITALIVIAAILKWITPVILAGALLGAAAYTQWILVSIWRCAYNVRTDAFGLRRYAWGMLARWLTVAWAIGAIGLAAILVNKVATK